MDIPRDQSGNKPAAAAQPPVLKSPVSPPPLEPYSGDPYYYDYIAVVLFCALLICCSFLIFLNIKNVEVCTEDMFGPRKAFILQLYFWAALGATVTSYKFFKDDKERNEVAFLNKTPDPLELRWPDSQNVILYIQRILMSGVMGIIGAVILLSGLSVFDSVPQEWGTKQKMGLIVFCVVVGMYQKDFLEFVSGIKDQFFKSKKEAPETPIQKH
jgi:hypothetical protein